MTSLSQLNDAAASPIEVTDARPATVIFDRFFSRDFAFDITSLNKVLVPQMGINEIVNYSTADVRYRLTIKSDRAGFISGSSLTFNGMPSGVSVATSTSTYAKVYTVSGLQSAKQFDQIKSPTWNLPSDYALAYKFWVESEIIYYDQELDEEVIKNWASYDIDYYYFAVLESSSNIEASVGYNKKFAAAVTASFDLDTDAPFTNFRMAATARAYVTTNGRKARLLSAGLTTATVFTGQGKFFRAGDQTHPMSSAFTVNCIAGEYVRPINRIDMFAVAGRIGPAGVPYLEGNGLPYYNTDGTLLNIGGLPPGITRIRPGAGAITTSATVTANVQDVKFAALTAFSNSTLTATAERRPGIIQNLQAVCTITAAARFDYVLQPTNLFQQAFVTAQAARSTFASADITASSSLSAIGQLYAPMLITVNVPANAPSNQRVVVFGFDGTTAVNIEWGDGTSSNLSGTFAFDNSSGFIGHTYASSGSSTDYEIKINGLNFPSASVTGFQVPIYNGSYEPKYRIKSIDSWGGLGVQRYNFAFLACQNLQSVPNNIPSTVTSMNNMFSNIVSNQINTRLANIASWNTANVTNMFQMFLFSTYFNVNISSWNTANVTDMGGMFANTAFDQNISGWSVPLIPSKPTSFDTGTPATWTTAEKPNWGV
jgi:surface protein